LGSRNLATVEEVYRSMQEDGLRTGGEYLAEHSTEDAQIRLYTTGKRVLRGREEIRAFFAQAEQAGTRIALRPITFEEDGDVVTVVGTARLQRPEGGFAETHVRWSWRFRDGLIEATDWAPRAGG
jgi:ketosteroid isomerase-like protein